DRFRVEADEPNGSVSVQLGTVRQPDLTEAGGLEVISQALLLEPRQRAERVINELHNKNSTTGQPPSGTCASPRLLRNYAMNSVKQVEVIHGPADSPTPIPLGRLVI